MSRHMAVLLQALTRGAATRSSLHLASFLPLLKPNGKQKLRRKPLATTRPKKRSFCLLQAKSNFSSVSVQNATARRAVPLLKAMKTLKNQQFEWEYLPTHSHSSKFLATGRCEDSIVAVYFTTTCLQFLQKFWPCALRKRDCEICSVCSKKCGSRLEETWGRAHQCLIAFTV